MKWYKKLLPKKDEDGNKVYVDRGTIRLEGYRRTYQNMKRAYMRRVA